MFKIIKFLPVFLFIIISKTTAQVATQIKGQVVDSISRVPVAFASVGLLKENDILIKAQTTDENGNFQFDIPDRTGIYILRFSYIGYKNQAIRLDRHSITNLGKIRLQPSLNQLSEVKVTGRKPLIQNKGDKIIYNASADISNKAGSAADVLRKAPMLTVTASGELKMRGSSGIKVLLNGMPSPILAKNLKEALKIIPANTIESVEVITSPSAKYEAEGATGIINIITKKKVRGTNGNLNLSAGNLEQTASGGLNIAKGKFNFNLSLDISREKEQNTAELNRRSLKDKQEIGMLIQRTEALQHSRGAFGDFSADFHPDSTQKIGLGVSFWGGGWPGSDRLYNYYKSNQGITEYNQHSEQKAKFGNTDFSLNYQKKSRRPGQELQMLGQYSRTFDNSNYQTDQFYLNGLHYSRERSPNKSNNRDLSFQADYTHPLDKSGKQLLETGARFSNSEASSAYTVFNDRNNPGSPALEEDPARSDVMGYFQRIMAAYASIQLQTNNNWIFRPGLRYENTSLGANFQGTQPSFKAYFSNLVPSVMISKEINEQHTFKFNFSQRIRRPWIWDLNPYVNASDPRNLTSGNPALRPEITRMLEAGHSFNAAAGYTLNSSIFLNTNGNAIESLTTVDSLGISSTTSQNIASNRRLGANLNIAAQINKNWTVNAGAEYYHVRFKSPAQNLRNTGDVYSLSLNTSYILPADYTIQFSGNYSNGYVTLLGKNSADYTYHLSIRKEFLNKKAGITLGINNPFQKTLLQRGYNHASSFQSNTTNRYYNRSFTISFDWRFGNMRAEEKPEKEFTERPGRTPRGRKL